MFSYTNGKVTITGTTKGTTGGETVTLTVDGKEIGTATVNADGTFSAEVAATALTSAGNRAVIATVDRAGTVQEYTVEVNNTNPSADHDVIYVNTSNTLSGDSHVVGTVLDDVWVLTPKGTTMGGKYGVQYHGTLLDTGDGNDSITILDVNELPGVLGFITGSSPVTGSDYIRVNMGAGADVWTVEGKLADSGSMGQSVVRNKSISNSQVDMGEGDDVVNLGNGIAYDKDGFSETYIDGGAGYDTLNITGGGVTQSMATVNPRTGATTNTNFIKGFEVIDLGDSGNSLTNVTWTAIQNNNAEQALRILSDGGMGSDAASVGLDSTWSQVGTETADGVTYDVYHSSSNTANNDNLDIWIQQGIQII